MKKIHVIYYISWLVHIVSISSRYRWMYKTMELKLSILFQLDNRSMSITFASYKNTKIQTVITPEDASVLVPCYEKQRGLIKRHVPTPVSQNIYGHMLHS